MKEKRTMDQDWFEMKDIRRRSVADRVWVPLRAIQTLTDQGKYGYEGFSKEFFGLGSVALPIKKRKQGERLGWSDIGIGHEQRSYAFSDSYKSADIYQYHDKKDLGLELVLEQRFSGELVAEWHLHQDFVIALGLYREGDTWLCPNEAFAEVVRLRRNTKAQPESIEVKAEYLRDYLAARNMALRLTWYRERIATVSDASFIAWPNGELHEHTKQGRFEGRSWQVGEGGDLVGAGVAVFRAWRTDVDPEVDVPIFGPEDKGNTAHESHSFTRRSERTLQMIQGEVWQNEWIEPAKHSARVRHDNVPATVFFVTDAVGTRESRETLDDEDVGKYLWFRGGIISTILQFRGSSLDWYTGATGGVRLTPDYHVHFGVNELGLVNAYAHDIAKLPEWQQQVWVGQNVTPEGGVSAELLDAQMRTEPARTKAPERLFAEALAELGEAFAERYGSPLLRAHDSKDEILRSIHRFRAIDSIGLLALAKDVARLTADSFDTGELNRIAAPPKGDKWGSLKSLEKALDSLWSVGDTRKLMAPLVGIYDLRLGDAHLPTSKINEAFELVGIDRAKPSIYQGTQLIYAVAWALHWAAEIIAGRKGPEFS